MNVYFTVQGRGTFPEDMLRHDRAVFVSSRDEFESKNPRSRRITLKTDRMEAITAARWSSFGWSVVGWGDDAPASEAAAEEQMGPIENFR